MLLLIALVFVVALGKGVNEKSIQILKGTKQLNYTFYHIHTYPQPEDMTIYIYFRQTGQQFNALLLSFNRALDRIHNQTKDFANKPRPTYVQQQPIYSDYGSKQLILSATIVLQILDESNLPLVVDKIQQISKTESIQIASISREYWNLFDLEMEEEKAMIEVQRKGKQICEKYFGMRYKRLEVFEKWRDIIEEQDNQTIQQGQELGQQQFVGDLSQAYDQIDLMEYEQRFIDGNEVFKCSIICENIKTITQKDVQNLIKKAQTKQKIPKKETQHITKKSKKINLKKYQKQLQGIEL